MQICRLIVFFLILFSVVFINALNAQDFIIKKNGDELSAKLGNIIKNKKTVV